MTEWNPIFAYATLEMGVGVELCWPYRAQQKGSVENSGGKNGCKEVDVFNARTNVLLFPPQESYFIVDSLSSRCATTLGSLLGKLQM